MLGQTIPRIEYQVLAVVQLILCEKALLWNGNPGQSYHSVLRASPPQRGIPEVIRGRGVPYPYGEIEHDVIAALQIPHKGFLEKAFR